MGRSGYTSATNVLCNFVYVCFAAWLLVGLIGSDGLYLSFAACYVMVLITHLIYGLLISRATGRRGFDRLLFLPADYEVSDDNQRVCSVSDLEGCIMASQQMAGALRDHGVDEKTSNLLCLFIEEVTMNIMEHGFRDGRNNIIVVKTLFLEDRITLNIMDNCPLFDPGCYYDKLKVHEDPSGGIGIRLVVGLAKDVVYTNSFNMNNVRIEI